MQTPLAPVVRDKLNSGLITESAVAENSYPLDACTEAINWNFDVLGRATLRSGTTLVGNTLSGNLLGLYNFRDSGSGTNNRLIAVNGSSVYYLGAASTWTSIRSVTASLKARFSTFLDYVFMVNGTDATAIWDGSSSTSFLTTGNASGAPTGKFIDNYRARMWIAGNSTYPDRLYYSSVPSAVTTPVITWDTSVTTGQWIDISPSDGENITALHRTKNALLVFKNNHIYNVYSINQTDPDAKFNVGTYSQESVVETKNGVYFHHPTGFYRYDGDVQEISRPIIDIVQAVTLTNYSKVCGYLEQDGDHVCWAVGSVTYKGITYSNMVVRYTISTQTWAHYQYPTQHLVSSPYNDGSTIFTVVGDDSGNVLKINTGNTDNTTPLSYSIITAWDDIDGAKSTRKIINNMLFMQKGASGSKISYQIPGDILNDWSKGIGQMRSSNSGFSDLAIGGAKFRFKISGSSTGEPMAYEGYEILKGLSELINFG